CRGDEVADHRDQADNAINAVADVGTRQDEGDIQQLSDRIEPRQPLLLGEIAERIGAGMAEIEAKAAKSVRPQIFRNLAAILVDDRPAPGAAARTAPLKCGAGTTGGTRVFVGGTTRIKIVWHNRQMGNSQAARKPLSSLIGSD